MRILLAELKTALRTLRIVDPWVCRSNAGYKSHFWNFSLHSPSTFRGGWTTCGRNAKAILKGRKLKSVDIFLYPTGTGLGENGPYLVGHMTRMQSSPQGDTWELPIGNLMTTNFWAQAIDENGKTIKSIDLANVSG